MKENESVYCRRCNNAGAAKKLLKGSGAVELILWIVFVIIFFGILIPVIYSIWRRTGCQKVCQICGSSEIIPAWVRRNEQSAAGGSSPASADAAK